MTTPRAVLAFWFSGEARPRWFEKDKAFDDEIRSRFGTLVHAAQLGELDSWQQSPEGALALLLLLDQFSRNIYRQEAKAFLGDARARAVADRAIAQGFDGQFEYDRQRFFYLPFEHGESPADQQRCIQLFTQALDRAVPADRDAVIRELDYAHRHRVVIERFGRFPHRNAALGRPSTAAEESFLKERDSAF